jgi:hypothetical protein
MENFEAVIGRLMLAHARLKAIDAERLTEERRKDRSKRMRELRKAIEHVIALRYGELSDTGKQNADLLDQATSDLTETLAGTRSAVQVINTVGAGIGAIVNLIGLIA